MEQCAVAAPLWNRRSPHSAMPRTNLRQDDLMPGTSQRAGVFHQVDQYFVTDADHGVLGDLAGFEFAP